MIQRGALCVVEWLIRSNAIKDEDKELYVYAMYSFLLSFAPIVFAVIFGICMGCLDKCITIIVPFAVIRKFGGGFHTKHSWSCLIISSVLLLSCVYVSLYCECNLILMLVAGVAVVILIVCSPVDSENRRLEESEKKQYKKITIRIAVFFYLLSTVLKACGVEEYAKNVAIGITLAAILQLPYALNYIKIKLNKELK